MSNPFDWKSKMSDTLNEALTSRDAEFIKRARTI